MPTKRPKFIKGEIYHIILRGIENRKIFLNNKDRLRFIYNLIEFNDEAPVFHNFRKFQKFIKAFGRDNIPTKRGEKGVISFTEMDKKRKEKKKRSIIEILAICLMPNHVHLLVRQLTKNGISLFFQKMGGYSTYFNKKYNRFGSLFQRPFKAVHIKTQEQLEIVICYIHTNPVELIEPKWKEKGIKNLKRAEKFIENYKWSSLGIFLGKENLLSEAINRTFVDKIFKNPAAHRRWIKARLFQKVKLRQILKEFERRKIKLE